MRIVVGVVVVIVAFIGGVLLSNSMSSSGGEDGASVRDVIPSHTLTDRDGNNVELAEVIEGTPAVVNSWATWCPFCVNELPDFAELQAELEGEVVFVAINRGESVEQAEEFIEEVDAWGLTYLYNSADTWYRTIGGFAMPETLFVDAEGKILFHKRGSMSYAEAKALIETHLLGVTE